MKDMDYAQCNILVRVREKQLLTNEQFRDMIYAQDENELRHLLSKTPYSAYLPEGGDPIEPVLAALDADEGKTLAWAAEIAPQPDVVAFFALRQDYHNLKVLCKEEILEQPAQSALLTGGLYSVDLLRQLVKTRSCESMPPEMVAAVQDVMDRSESHDDVQQVDVVFDRYYLRQILAIAQNLGDPEVLAFVQYNVDMFNVSVLLRANQQGYGRTFLQSVLSSAGAVRKHEWIEMRDKDLRKLTENLRHSPYSKEVEQAIDGESGLVSATAFDLVRDNALLDYLRKAKLKAFGPLPLLAYLYARELERKNLRIVLKSRRAGFRRAVAEQRLRYSYVV